MHAPGNKFTLTGSLCPTFPFTFTWKPLDDPFSFYLCYPKKASITKMINNNTSILQLPQEILDRIYYFAPVRVLLALCIPVDAEKMFREGGPSIVLETILEQDADIRSLIQLVKFIPAELAIAKAVRTQNIQLLIRVCTLWDTWYSVTAYNLAYKLCFEWALRHLKTDIPLNSYEWNNVYIRLGKMDQVDLSISKPLQAVEFSGAAYRHLDRFVGYLDVYAALAFRANAGDYEGLCKAIEQDVDRKLNFTFVLRYLVHDESPRVVELYERYHELYDSSGNLWNTFVEILKSNFCYKHMHRLGLPHVHMYKCLKDKDIAAINAAIRADPEGAIDALPRIRMHYHGLSLEELDIPEEIWSHEALRVFRREQLIPPVPMDVKLYNKYQNTTQKKRLEMIRNGTIDNLRNALPARQDVNLESNIAIIREFTRIHGISAFKELSLAMAADQGDFLGHTLQLWLENKEDTLWFMNTCLDLGYTVDVKDSKKWDTEPYAVYVTSNKITVARPDPIVTCDPPPSDNRMVFRKYCGFLYNSERILDLHVACTAYLLQTQT